MIRGEVELDELLATFAVRVARALGADRATLWLIDGETGDLRSRVATLPELAELRVPAGQGIVGHVAATGEVVNIRDASADPRWAPSYTDSIGYRVTSILSAPIVNDGEIRGVLQLLNKQHGAFERSRRGLRRPARRADRPRARLHDAASQGRRARARLRRSASTTSSATRRRCPPSTR